MHARPSLVLAVGLLTLTGAASPVAHAAGRVDRHEAAVTRPVAAEMYAGHRPGLPDPVPRAVPMPHVLPAQPGPVPMPLVRPRSPGPVPMPEIGPEPLEQRPPQARYSGMVPGFSATPPAPGDTAPALASPR